MDTFRDFRSEQPTPMPDLKRFFLAQGFKPSDEELALWQQVRACSRCRANPLVAKVCSSATGHASCRINGYALNIESPLSDSPICRGKYIGLGAKGTVMFIGMNPGTSRVDGDRALAGDARSAGGILQAFIRHFLPEGTDPFSRFYFTDLVKCSTVGNKLQYSTGDGMAVVDNCFEFLLRELQMVKPKRLVLLGKPVRDAFSARLGALGLCSAPVCLPVHTAANQKPAVLTLRDLPGPIEVFAFPNTSRRQINFNMGGDADGFREWFRAVVA